MSAEVFTACERLLSATANGVYQGVLVAALAGLSLRLFPRTNAATRHAVWFGVLLFVAALIPAHLFLSSRPRPEIPMITIQPASDEMALAFTPSYDGNTALPDPQPDESNVSGEIVSPTSPDAVATENAWRRFTQAILTQLYWNLETAIHLPHSICLGLISVWALLASVRIGLMARRIGEVRRVKTTSSAPSQELQALFDKLRQSLTARRDVRLKVSSTHRTAVVLGFVHPVVLLPTEMDAEANHVEVEHVLRHELAHVDRRDDWGNLAQQMIQAALFFHPAVWWISTKISLEREIACDDHVLEASGAPRAYALTLANVASRMHQCRQLLAPGVSNNNNSQLQQRITMILNTHRDRSPRLARSRLGILTTATAIIAVLAIDAGPRLVLAQQSPVIAATAGPDSATPVADGAPATLPPDQPGAESGPRAKSGSSSFGYSAGSSSSSSSTTAEPAEPPTPPVAPDAPVPAARPALPAPPAPPAARPRRKSMSVEERLDRVERILEEIEAHEGMKSHHLSIDSFPRAEAPTGRIIPDGMPADTTTDWRLKRASDEAKRAVQQAQRAVEASQRAAEASQRDAEQAMRDAAKLQSKDYERLQEKWSEDASQAPLRELQALRSARESLEKELQNLARQIKRLEEDQNRPKKMPHVGLDDPNKGAKPVDPAPEKTL